MHERSDKQPWWMQYFSWIYRNGYKIKCGTTYSINLSRSVFLDVQLWQEGFIQRGQCLNMELTLNSLDIGGHGMCRHERHPNLKAPRSPHCFVHRTKGSVSFRLSCVSPHSLSFSRLDARGFRSVARTRGILLANREQGMQLSCQLSQLLPSYERAFCLVFVTLRTDSRLRGGPRCNRKLFSCYACFLRASRGPASKAL